MCNVSQKWALHMHSHLLDDSHIAVHMHKSAKVMESGQ